MFLLDIQMLLFRYPREGGHDDGEEGTLGGGKAGSLQEKGQEKTAPGQGRRLPVQPIDE
jgi:hypothetical protein